MRALTDEARRFSIVRILVGLYSFWLFWEIWIARGPLFWDANAPRWVTSTFIPNVLFLGGPVVTNAVLLTAMAAALALTAGVCRRFSVFILWVSLVLVFIANRVIREVHHDLWVWLLLVLALQPGREPWRIGGSDPDFAVDHFFRRWSLPFVGLMYTVSGLSKWSFEGWTSGEVIAWLGRTHWPSPSIEGAVKAMSSPVPALAWMGMGVEVLALPLLLIPRLRLTAWLMLTALQTFILIFYQLENISILMLIFHFWLFDPAWLPRRKGVA